MSREDVRDYDGLTINEAGQEERREETGSGIHVRVVSLSAMPWWKKALYGAVIVAAAAVMLMLTWFFLVGGLVVAGALAILYVLRRFLQK